MAKYKLTYFDLTGRGEPIRYIFAIAQVPFEDVRIKFEDWPALKPTIQPWEVLPTLQVGDRTISQSLAVARFLARRFNLVGSNEFDNAKCDELVDATIDFAMELWMKYVHEPDAAKKETAKKNLYDTVIPKTFGKFDKIQGENGGNWLVGKSVTWADAYLVGILEATEQFLGAGIIKKYPNLKKLKDVFHALPGIKDYTAKRPSA